jgi:hypothetical protein
MPKSLESMCDDCVPPVPCKSLFNTEGECWTGRTVPLSYDVDGQPFVDELSVQEVRPVEGE